MSHTYVLHERPSGMLGFYFAKPIIDLLGLHMTDLTILNFIVAKCDFSALHITGGLTGFLTHQIRGLVGFWDSKVVKRPVGSVAFASNLSL